MSRRVPLSILCIIFLGWGLCDREELSEKWSLTATVELAVDEEFRDAIMHVSLLPAIEDVRAEPFARIAVHHVDHFPGRSWPKVVLELAEVDPDAEYYAEAFIDLDRDGEVGRGDMISTRAYPIPRATHRHNISMVVKKIQ